MNYSAKITNSKLTILNGDKKILENLTVRANFNREKDIVFVPTEITSEAEKIIVNFSIIEDSRRCPEATEVKLILEQVNTALLFKLKFVCNDSCGPYCYALSPFYSANLDFDYCGERFTSLYNLSNTNVCWQEVSFKNPKDIPQRMSSITAEVCEKAVNFLPVVNRKIAAELASGGVEISTRIMGVNKIDSYVLSVNLADLPKTATAENVKAQKSVVAIAVPLKSERKYPKCLEGFGWCTWDAFYHDVTADKIITKLDEFKAMGILPSWLLIDDGWSELDGGFLVSFEEDRKKFPEGLKALIEKVKKDYGIKYVGVWHAYTGYWEGIKPKGSLHKKFEGKLLETPNGKVYPAGDEQNTYEFWAAWYTYLKAQGVDFVKVDNQTAIQRKCDGFFEGASGTFNSQAAHDRAVEDFFGGAVINCMGTTFEDMVARPSTMISRNSDDFFPNRENDFCLHTIQNAHTAILHDEFYNCDYDMFFSKHQTAIGSAMLRAISGGPAYVSDKIGGSDKEVLEHLCTPSGEIFTFDNAAIVTPDCFFVDCETEKKPLKVYNVSGKNIAVAAFGVSPDAVAKGTLTLADIPEANGKYLAHSFFEDRYFVFDSETIVELNLLHNGYALYTLYPIGDDGTVSVGDKTFYAEGATPTVATDNYETFLD